MDLMTVLMEVVAAFALVAVALGFLNNSGDNGSKYQPVRVRVRAQRRSRR